MKRGMTLLFALMIGATIGSSAVHAGECSLGAGLPGERCFLECSGNSVLQVAVRGLNVGVVGTCSDLSAVCNGALGCTAASQGTTPVSGVCACETIPDGNFLDLGLIPDLPGTATGVVESAACRCSAPGGN